MKTMRFLDDLDELDGFRWMKRMPFNKLSTLNLVVPDVHTLHSRSIASGGLAWLAQNYHAQKSVFRKRN